MKKFALFLAFCLIVLTGCQNQEFDLNKISQSLNTYTMELAYSSDNTLSGKQTLSYKNNTETTLNEVCFHLYARAFSEGASQTPVSELNKSKAYPNGISYGDIEILSVSVNQVEADFSFDNADQDILCVGLKNGLKPTDSCDISIEYSVVVPNILHRFGYGENTVNMANFYPVASVFEDGEFNKRSYHYNGDPFYSDVSNYLVTLTVPSNFVLASTGNILSQTENNESTSYKIEAKAVRDFAFVLSEKFEVVSAQVDGVTVEYFYYDDPNYEANLQAGIDAVKTFNNLFGVYPYEKLSIVKSNFMHGGMEYSNLVYISDDKSLSTKDYINVIVHEIAHQWWYGVVGSNAYKYGWLDEGLTEFSTFMFYEQNLNYGVDTKQLLENTNNSYVAFVDLYTDVLGEVDTSMNRELNEYLTEPEYVYMAYVKGMMLFEHLRGVVGEEVFMQTLKNYYANNMFKIVTPEHFIGEIEKASGTELKGLINSWVLGKVVIMEM